MFWMVASTVAAQPRFPYPQGPKSPILSIGRDLLMHPPMRCGLQEQEPGTVQVLEELAPAPIDGERLEDVQVAAPSLPPRHRRRVDGTQLVEELLPVREGDAAPTGGRGPEHEVAPAWIHPDGHPWMVPLVEQRLVDLTEATIQ